MEGLGHKNVETLVQSGNVVFTSRAAADDAREAARDRRSRRSSASTRRSWSHARRARRRDRGEPVPRSPRPEEEPARHVPLRRARRRARVKKLESTDFGDDRLAFKDREIYIAYEDGMGRSELAKQLDQGEARRRRHRPQLEHGHEAAGDVRRARRVQHPRGDHAADRAEQVALPRDARRRDEPEHQRRAVDREHQQPDHEVHRAAAPHAARDQVGREAEHDPAGADVVGVRGREQPRAEARDQRDDAPSPRRSAPARRARS